MMDAWFRRSAMIASRSSRRGANTPRLASKQEPKSTVSSVPRKSEILRSASLWTFWVPQMKRTEESP